MCVSLSPPPKVRIYGVDRAHRSRPRTASPITTPAQGEHRAKSVAPFSSVCCVPYPWTLVWERWGKRGPASCRGRTGQSAADVWMQPPTTVAVPVFQHGFGHSGCAPKACAVGMTPCQTKMAPIKVRKGSGVSDGGRAVMVTVVVTNNRRTLLRPARETESFQVTLFRFKHTKSIKPVQGYPTSVCRRPCVASPSNVRSTTYKIHRQDTRDHVFIVTTLRSIEETNIEPVSVQTILSSSRLPIFGTLRQRGTYLPHFERPECYSLGLSLSTCVSESRFDFNTQLQSQQRSPSRASTNLHRSPALCYSYSFFRIWVARRSKQSHFVTNKAKPQTKRKWRQPSHNDHSSKTVDSEKSAFNPSSRAKYI
ncbi:hypothetical protein B0J13DRAFT_604241 [Dactylonectria estremocensis]|uniref:Uncharacterized protein n=1 Tax=Dactylonectria estremocensis TaxID=1079267 RepID=A0A9P9J923_9HYPO|nr:hypothetical protein B0J13DRAFT_604241 [Dactylonectria estremocensis]